LPQLGGLHVEGIGFELDQRPEQIKIRMSGHQPVGIDGRDGDAESASRAAQVGIRGAEDVVDRVAGAVILENDLLNGAAGTHKNIGRRAAYAAARQWYVLIFSRHV